MPRGICCGGDACVDFVGVGVGVGASVGASVGLGCCVGVGLGVAVIVVLLRQSLLLFFSDFVAHLDTFTAALERDTYPMVADNALSSLLKIAVRLSHD